LFGESIKPPGGNVVVNLAVPPVLHHPLNPVRHLACVLLRELLKGGFDLRHRTHGEKLHHGGASGKAARTVKKMVVKKMLRCRDHLLDPSSF
jgi:hypothetical protein